MRVGLIAIGVPVAALLLLCGIAWWVMDFAPGLGPLYLVDQCDNRRNVRDTAPIVVVGVLASDTVVRGLVPMHSDPSYPLELRKLHVRIENVLKGAVRGATAEVYYFALAGGFQGNQPLGMWREGSRRILWLRRDSGVLRTACDGFDSCTLGVNSGAHPNFKADPRRPLSYDVSDILLTRGDGQIDADRFAAAILRGAPAPDVYLIGLYRHLALTEKLKIKTAACNQLWICAHAPATWSKVAAEAMREAGCICALQGAVCGRLDWSDLSGPL